MATSALKITNEWQKVSDGENVVLQNINSDLIEVGTSKDDTPPDVGFILGIREFFSYSGGEKVFVKAKNKSYIVIDNIGV